ncbi:hypothetical protein INR49_012305 [Caranx melampygus]|nr:hypothetical protein INR49_012305 [Caranx melampygus]
MEPNPKISQSEAAAPLTDNEKVEPTTENLPDVTATSVEPSPVLIPEAVTQEDSVHLDSKPVSDTNKEEKTIEVETCMPTEKPQIDEPQASLAVTVNTDINVEQTDSAKKTEAEVTTEIKAEPEAVVEKPALTEAVPHPPVESVQNASPADHHDNGDVHKPDETQPKLKPEPLNPTDKSAPIAPGEGETVVLEKANEENITETKKNDEVVTKGETVKQEIHEEAADKTVKDTAEEKIDREKVIEKESVEERAIEKAGTENKSSNGKAFEGEVVRMNVAAEGTAEVKTDRGKAFEEEATEQSRNERANDQKPPEEELNNAKSSLAPSSSETEAAQTAAKEIPQEEIQTQKETGAGANCESSAVKESVVETVSLPEKSEDKEAQSAGQKEEVQAPLDTMVKEDDKSEEAAVTSAALPPDSKEQEKVTVEEPAQSVEMVSSSAVISETSDRNEDTMNEKLIQGEIEPGSQKTNCTDENQHEAEEFARTGSDEKQLEKVAEPSVKEEEAKLDKKESEPKSVAGSIQETISLSEANAVCDKDSIAQFDVEENTKSKTEEASQTAFESGGASVSVASVPLAEPEIPVSVVSEQDKGLDEGNTNVEEKENAKAQPLEKPTDEEAVAEMKTVETLKEPGDKDMGAKESSPTSPSDLAKLENTVLPILEAQANTQPKDEEEKLTDTLKTRRKLEVLPLSPDSPSSEDDRELSEKNIKGTTRKKLLVPMDVRADSLDDSSESFGKESPMSGDDEEFIRKQIMEMSENEDASPSDEENVIRRKIRENEKKQMEQKKTETVERSTSGKSRRLTKKSTISPDDGEDKQLCGSLDKPDIDKEEGTELKVDGQQGGTAVRKFQSMELNATSSPVRITNDDGEPEIESLTDSPDDRSRGEGSSSLHASSFTPGTSPTSLSSLDEDSDSSSPSHIRSDEGKQHRKAKHRQPGQMLPTIEDSSEEEELREEEELLREQEKQKGSGKKSKKTKKRSELRGGESVRRHHRATFPQLKMPHQLRN